MAERHSSYALADAGIVLGAAEEFAAEVYADGAAHLWAELEHLDLLLERETLSLRARKLINENEFRGLYLSEAQVDALLNRNGHADGERRGLKEIQLLAEAIEKKRIEIDARVEASLRAGLNLPLVRLSRLFALTPFETKTLLLCIAPELDYKYATLYAYVQNDVTKKYPTVNLALNLFCRTREERLLRRQAFTPDGALLRHQLLRLFDEAQEREPTLLSRFMKADERATDFLLEHDRIDNRLHAFTECGGRFAGRLCEQALPAELKTKLSRAAQASIDKDAVFLFHGPYGVGKRAAAEAICAEQETPLLVADLRQAVAAEQSFALTLSLLRREAVLRRAALYFNHLEVLLTDEALMKDRLLILARELGRPDCLIFLGSEVPWHPIGLWQETCFLSFKFPLPEFPLRLKLWKQALAGCGFKLAPDVDVETVAGKFILSGGQIQDAVREVTHLLKLRATKRRRISIDDLHRAARDQSNQSLSRLAQKIEHVYEWKDIVLPPRAVRQLREVCVSVKYRHVVHSQWGFDGKLSLGKGLNVLFSGPSGTGKTMAAQILAHELSLDLYKIDLPSVISKYIGETEQNLSRIFREAESSNAIIFFDEADAIFGKRSEVKDAHDRYANIEVAYLLQKMEEYEGIVILATNLSKNMDDAFARRMRHAVEFPFPDAAYREHIWRNIFPAEAPLAADVDLGFLSSQFELSGGNIRNVALAAAFLAAEEGCEIRMVHLILSTAREMQKIGKLPSKANFRHYYELIRERS
ncbi:MAG TPA: AAA family ATPase [Pyrinomonadaceae bacterium]|nr:AAA family ATPase [Pyrinomonadaceae bacterium]